MKNVLNEILLLVIIPACLTAGDMDSYFQKYLKTREDKNMALFLACCNSDTNEQYKALLFIDVGGRQCLLVEMNSKIIINLAKISFRRKKLYVTETNGGNYTYERVNKLANELIKQKFHLLYPVYAEEVEKIITIENCEKCKNTP